MGGWGGRQGLDGALERGSVGKGWCCEIAVLFS
jgi:hypothetical protein